MRLFSGCSWHPSRQPLLRHPLSSRFALHCLRAFDLGKGTEKHWRTARSSLQNQSPPKGAGKLVPRENGRKVSEIFLTLFDNFWRFFALRDKCRKESKYFWHFLTTFDVFDVAPFRWPQLRSADKRKTRWRRAVCTAEGASEKFGGLWSKLLRIGCTPKGSYGNTAF